MQEIRQPGRNGHVVATCRLCHMPEPGPIFGSLLKLVVDQRWEQLANMPVAEAMDEMEHMIEKHGYNPSGE